MGAKHHGHSKTPLYKLWQNVVDRCENPNNPHFHNYGGRGIRLHPEWRASFLAFKEGVGPRPSPRHTLEREDNNGHYEPGNVCWATRKEQAQNMRKNHFLTVNDRTLTIAAWAEEMGLAPSAIHYRLKTGMTPEEAVLTPRRGGRWPESTKETGRYVRKRRARKKL
jgi:hypothetical protein